MLDPEVSMAKAQPVTNVSIWGSFGVHRVGRGKDTPADWTHPPEGIITLVDSKNSIEQPIGPTWGITGVSPDQGFKVFGMHIGVAETRVGRPRREVEHYISLLFRVGETHTLGVPGGVCRQLLGDKGEGSKIYRPSRAELVHAGQPWSLSLVIHEPLLSHLQQQHSNKATMIGGTFVVQVWMGGITSTVI